MNKNTAADTATILRTIARETLLSYRLLFGMRTSSRNLFLKTYLKQLGAPETEEFWKTLLAPPNSKRLKSLPIHCWPTTVIDDNGELKEEAVYDASSNFLFLGDRLALVQNFHKSRSPRSLKAFWYDRQNKSAWFTYWFALVVGGSSILLSIGQLVVAVLQYKQGEGKK